MRCLFIGLGGVGQRHLRNVRRLLGEDAELCAYRVRGERHVLDDAMQIVAGADLVRDFRIEVFADLGSALATGPDITFVANPTSDHVPVALAAARAGSDLFLEKPVAASLEGLDELESEVEARGLVAMVAYQLRQHPGFRRLRQIAPDLGPLCSVTAEVGEYLPDYHPYEDYRRMYASRRAQGGGVVLTQIHELDLLHALFGVPRRVVAFGGHLSSLEIDVEDQSSALLEYWDPAGRVFPATLHQDFLQRPKRRALRLVGDRGQATLSLSEARLTQHDASGRVILDERYDGLPRNQLFVDELRHFLQCVQERRAPEITLADGRASLEVALAIRASLDGAGIVQLRDRGSGAKSAPRASAAPPSRHARRAS